MGNKVLMVLESEFPPDDRVFKEAKSLTEHGFLVTIACYTFGGKPLNESWNDITIIRKKIPRLIYKSSVAALKFPVYFNWWKRYLNNILRTDSFDILHIHDLPLAKVGSYFKRKQGLKLVVDLHENWPAYLEKAIHVQSFLGKLLSSNQQWREYEKEELKFADLIITVVEEMQNRIADLGHSLDKIIVLQNAIEPEKFTLKGLNPDSKHFTLFYAGDIARVRGIQTILDDLVLAKKEIPGLRFWIVGKGNYLEGLQQLVVEKKLTEVVEFKGWLPLVSVLEQLEQADIGLMPHLRWEQNDLSSPNKLFQYMHLGKPALCSPSDSVIRIVNETQSGLIYDYNIEGDFLEKLLTLYRNPGVRKKMGENGKFWVKEKYNWKMSAQAYLRTYESLLR